MVAPWVDNTWGNATSWSNAARNVGFTVDRNPAGGSVIVFTVGQYDGARMTVESKLRFSMLGSSSNSEKIFSNRPEATQA